MASRPISAVIAVLATVGSLTLTVADAHSATPDAGTLDAPGESVAWSGEGSTSDPTAELGCAVPMTCDTFALTIARPQPSGGETLPPHFEVRITASTDDPVSDWDFEVFDPEGNEVAGSAHEGTVEEIVLADPPDGTYTVVAKSFAVTPGSTYEASATLTMLDDAATQSEPTANLVEQIGSLDAELECTEAVPEAVGVSGVTDDGATIALDVEVRLDGVSQARAEELMAVAATSYAPLDIELRVTEYIDMAMPNFDTFTVDGEGDVESVEAYQYMAALKEATNGAVAQPADIVLGLTSKHLVTDDNDNGAVDEDEDSVIGMADCIGGIRFDEHSYVVSEDTAALNDLYAGGVGLYVDEAAKTIAHEIGHLMGAHHHYSNCVEGLADDVTPANLQDPRGPEVTPCTVMWLSSPGSRNFGALEGAVVRGHADGWARP